MVKSARIFLTSYLLLTCFSSCNNSGETVKPVIKPLVEAVYASGYVVAKNEYEVYAQAEGYVMEKQVNDGAEVKVGDPLYVIDSDQQSARYRIAKENYEMAKRNSSNNSPVLSELKTSLEVAHTKMQFDSVNLVRYTNLINSNATTRSDYDRIKLTYENSRNEFLLQKSRYEKTKDQLHLDLKNAENQLRIATDETKRYTIKSQIDGMVYKTSKEQGEMIRRGEVIAVIGQRDGFYLELSVDELDINKVKKGQKVLAKIDAYPDKVFEATVNHVFPMINKQQQSVQVDATLNESLPGWFSGLALEANIIIQEKDKAIVIPKSVLLPGDSVWIDSDNGKKKIKVMRGIETLDEVEIVQGLDTTDRLVNGK